MGITTTYKCDRCGHEQNKDEQMWTIGIGFSHGTRTPSVSKHALWCRKCMEEVCLLGVTWNSKNEPSTKQIDPPPTLEDIIREIVCDEIANNGR